MSRFNFYRRKPGQTPTVGGDIRLIFPGWDGKNENVAFIGPHDDDICLSAGLLVQAVNHFGGNSYLIIVTDGKQGYCSGDEKATIYDTRVRETTESASILGVHATIRLDYPDGDLVPDYKTSDPGLIWGITQTLKEMNATRVVVPTFNDAHPDHKYTNEATRICVFHANGGIWDGRKTNITTLLETAVYCPFDTEPDLALKTEDAEFNRKLQAIAAYRSQKQIASLVERIVLDGPVEIFRTVSPPNYSAGDMFLKYFGGNPIVP